ncbi:MAG: translation elongation factor 4 [Ardenticatenaceae bacterium]|nr:translation elongation factor 4 [Ardenticatenaceae bacterium]
MDQSHIRNFCIIAHIDHGKSTLADRLLVQTGTITEREMREQVLDDMDLEREKGVTIKASAVRMFYTAPGGQAYELNLIDTPGHVDFTYEVSRALQACEGAVLVVDAVQGVQAQTLANLYMAIDADLEIIPVVNKIDLPSADPDAVAEEIEKLVGLPAEEVIPVSAKTGLNTDAVLEAVVQRVPPPKGDPEAPLRALIFDSHYDSYKGVVAYVRVIDGEAPPNRRLMLMAEGIVVEPLEMGVFAPRMTPIDEPLRAGEVGYVATGLKDVKQVRVGDTLSLASRPAKRPLPGYQPAKPMVFAGIYPVESDDFMDLRDALDKLRLNDASLTYQPETSVALGFGFRVGFLGLFHMEIVQERLEREYSLNLIATAPSVAYRVLLTNGEEIEIDSPAELPEPNFVEEIREPWMEIQVWTPSDYIGPIMDLVTSRRGVFRKMEYLDEKRVQLTYELPLAELIVDFYDQLKSRTRGYASLDYRFLDYRAEELVKLDLLVNEEPVDALSIIVHRNFAYQKGDALTRKLKQVIPRQMFKVPIQASIGNRIIARQTVPALRKDVLAKCYGGDVTRKRKLLEKQKEGKKRMKMLGSVEIPQEAFMAVLKLNEGE